MPQIICQAKFRQICRFSENVRDILPYLKKIGISLPDFWLSRIANCALSLPIAFLLFRLFPCEAQVFSSFSEITVKPYSVSVPASVAMLLLGAFTIMDINLARDKKV